MTEPNHQPEFGGEQVKDEIGGNHPTEDPNQDAVEQRIQLGLHPFGGIQMIVRDLSGNTAQARIGPEEAWRLAGHLQTLTTILITNAYAEAQAMAEQNQIFVPGR